MSFWRRALGDRGERAAVRHLRRSGWKVVAQNFRCPAGEIDIIIDDGATIAFVEVRTRGGEFDGDVGTVFPMSKRRQVEQVARVWLASRPNLARAFRFDAILVREQSGKQLIEHIQDAFRPQRF